MGGGRASALSTRARHTVVSASTQTPVFKGKTPEKIPHQQILNQNLVNFHAFLGYKIISTYIQTPSFIKMDIIMSKVNSSHNINWQYFLLNIYNKAVDLLSWIPFLAIKHCLPKTTLTNKTRVICNIYEAALTFLKGLSIIGRHTEAVKTVLFGPHTQEALAQEGRVAHKPHWPSHDTSNFPDPHMHISKY